MAHASGAAGAPSSVQGALAVLAVLVLGCGFASLAVEAWRGSVSLRSAIWLALGFHVLVLALPLLGSRDAFIYGLYGRIVAVHHANPFVVVPADFAGDPLFRFVDRQWIGTPPVYGPVFLWLAAGIVRLFRSPASMILGFKIVAAVANLTTLWLAVRLARRWRPERATFAAVLVGLNPAVVLASVGGGHVDPLVGAGIVAALTCLYPSPGAERPDRRGLVATGILALCALVKFVAVLPLILGIVVSVSRVPRGHRGRWLAAHGLVAALVGAVGYLPFFQTHDPTFGLAHLFPFGSVVAPVFFLNNTIVDLVAAVAGPGPSRMASILVRVSAGMLFIGAFVLLARSLARRGAGLENEEEGSAWAWALLLVSLSFQWLYPWYVVWFAPLAWLLPRIGRRAAILLSGLLPVATATVDDAHAPAIARGIAKLDFYVLAPALLLLLIVLLIDLIRRARRGRLGTDQERAEEPVRAVAD
jgi:hypothetical protein